MCGIAGIFGCGKIEITRHNLNRMNKAISHRGPDGNGIELFDTAGLAHSRLAIIDVQGGQQPMYTEDKRFCITYNGELYNYSDLRKDLDQDGIHCFTNSDTEVLLKSWLHFGPACLQKFRGMFAFAIWDRAEKKGWLVRDRFGIKPLFIKTKDSQLIFGSEIKAILALVGTKPELDYESLNLLLNFRYIPGEKTLFKNVAHLPPGSYLEWGNGEQKVVTWALKTNSKNVLDRDDLQNLLYQAVERQLVSDVPVGAYLSGGIDSATIVVISSRVNKNLKMPTFTLNVGDSALEAKNAARTAEIFGLSNNREQVNFRLADILPKLIYHLEVPKVNAWQSSLIAEFTSRNVKVALSGLGGDEIFIGYNLHKILQGLSNIKEYPGCFIVLGRFGSKTLSLFNSLKLEEYQRGCHMLESLSNPSRVYGIIRNVWDSPENRARIYGSRMLDQKAVDAFSLLESMWPDEKDILDASLEFEIKNKMVNDLLLQEDRLSMAHGLEVRVPFLDEDLVDAVTSLNVKQRMPKRIKKGLMKQVVSKWVPNEITERPKSGFQLPIHSFYHSDIKPLAEIYLNKERVVREGLFNYEFIRKILNARPHKNLRWHYFLLYLMIGVNVWIDVFLEQSEVTWQ